ncbi:MAG: hypothetical protein AMJ61_12855 [Desulfobacterales bacterium SG8_35_2]|nr:MAG: hypothetical protein AMJ61_12855 [Desulfobacterales bacterium SG8_35_2]
MFFVFSPALAFAKDHTPEDRGKAHFNNSAFAEGKKSCSTCHPNGRGLAGAGTKTAFSIMGGEQNSLEDVINVCIVNANKGNAIGNNSVEMQELVSYIRSLDTQEGPSERK